MVVASPTFLVCQQLRCLTRFSLVRTQALFTNLLKARTQYSKGILLSPLSHASSMCLKSSIFKSPWITHRRRLSVIPSTIAYVTPSSLCRLSLRRQWWMDSRGNVKRRLDKRRIWQRPSKVLRLSCTRYRWRSSAEREFWWRSARLLLLLLRFREKKVSTVMECARKIWKRWRRRVLKTLKAQAKTP